MYYDKRDTGGDGARVPGEKSLSGDELALREALVELFPLGLTDDAPARRKARVAKRRAERAAARKAELIEAARRRADTLVSLSSRPTRRDDSMPDNGAANRRESWADRVEREAREQADQLRTNIAETEATLASLREEYAKVGAILSAIGAPAPPAPPAPAAPIAAAPPAEPPKPAPARPEPGPARRDPKSGKLSDEEQTMLRAFAEDSGIFTVKRAREALGAEGARRQAVSQFFHRLAGDGTIVLHGTPGSPTMFYTHRDYDGPVSLELARDQEPAPVDVPDTSQENVIAVAAAAARLGIFTRKRLAEESSVERTVTGRVLAALAEQGVITRHGGDRGPGVFYTHADYAGEATIDLARGGVPLRPAADERPAPEAAEPEPDPARGEELLRVLAERGPLSTRQLRQLGFADVKEVADELTERGEIVFDREVRDAHGFPYLRLPDDALPDDAVATPSEATRAQRRVASDPATNRAADAARQLGIFTIKRLDELLNGDKATNSTRATLSTIVRDLASVGLVRRYGPDRGAGVFFTHVDYTGPAELVIARGEVSREALAEEPVAEPEPEPEPPPAPTDMPPELASMPAAVRVGAPLAGRISAARDQKKVYDAVGRGPSVSGEIAKLAGLPSQRVASYLRELEEAGLVRRTGVERRGRDQTLGRPAFEYEVADGPAPQAAPEPEPEPEPEPAPEPSGPAPADEPRLEAVRDAVARWDGPITPGAVAIRREWDIDTVVERLSELARRGVLRDEGVEGAPVYVYVPPAGPGRAHSVQRSSAPAAAQPVGRDGKGETVAGTGRGQKVSNADVRQLIDAAKRDGCTAILAPNGHWRITTREGKKLLISNTPRSSRSVENDRTRLKRIGVNV